MNAIIRKPFVLGDGRQMPFSRAVAAGGFIFVSGQLAMDEHNRPVSDSIGEQTRAVISSIAGILAEFGGDLTDVVKANIWLTDPGHLAGFNEEYSQHFESGFPARAAVCSALLFPGFLVEMEVIAIQREAPSVRRPTDLPAGAAPTPAGVGDSV